MSESPVIVNAGAVLASTFADDRSSISRLSCLTFSIRMGQSSGFGSTRAYASANGEPAMASALKKSIPMTTPTTTKVTEW